MTAESANTVSEATLAVRRYALHSRQYLQNALRFLQEKEAGKAGELLWGSAAEAVHALGAYRNVPIRSHRELKNFVYEMANELSDPSLLEDFLVAESLHHNYYEVLLEPRDIEAAVESVRQFIQKTLERIPRELLAEPPVGSSTRTVDDAAQG